MKTKKKLILAISSFSLVFVSVIVAVVAIFAAQRQGVQTTFRISYTAKNVAATVQANYTVGATTTAMHTDAGKEELVFLPEMAEGTGKLSPDTDNIDMGEESVVYLEYIFANDSDTVDVAISLDTSAFELNNMRVSYAYSYSRITEYATMPTDDSFEPMMILGKTDENGDYATLYVYMKVEVDNLANDASFTGNIVYNLDRATPVKLEFENVSKYTNAVLMQTRYIPSGININDLPEPQVAGELGGQGSVWCDRSDNSGISYPMNITSNLIVYPRHIYHIYPGNGQISILNIEEWGPLYIKVPKGTRCSYGASIDAVTDGEYLILEELQTITIYDIAKASELKVFTPADLAIEGIKISFGKPADLEEKLFYAAYGEYPQTYVGNELNETLKGASLTPTGKSYTTDVNGTETQLVEYSYKLKKYACLNSATPLGSAIDFASGVNIQENGTYFFHVEPITAKAMQKNANGTYTMMVTSILGSMAFDDDNNIWESSNIRQFLNSTFLSESGLSSVAVETQIKNSVTGIMEEGSGAVTDDKIWLASVEDLLKWAGLAGSLDAFLNDGYVADGTNFVSSVLLTDMARATFAYYDICFDSGFYYLRSAGQDYSYVCGVYEGLIASAFEHLDATYGFFPVFAVNV